MVTKAQDLTRDQLAKKLKSLITVPKAAVVFSVDGVPTHIFLVEDPQDVLEAAQEKAFKEVFRPVLDENEDAFVRCSVHLVADDPEPGLPVFMRSLHPGIVVWTLGSRPEGVKAMPLPPVKTEAKASKKPKATTKKKTAASKKAAPKTKKSGGASPKKKTTAKAQTASRRTVGRKGKR